MNGDTAEMCTHPVGRRFQLGALIVRCEMQEAETRQMVPERAWRRRCAPIRIMLLSRLRCIDYQSVRVIEGPGRQRPLGSLLFVTELSLLSLPKK